LANRRVWASFGALPADRNLQAGLGQLAVAPDGCGLDAEGALWIADALAGRVLRVQEGGKILEELPVSPGVFACMLGGSDRRMLFLCSAPDFDRTARSAAREAQLLSCRVDVPHAGRP
jgi:sugar lactone lactonase YvrE